jgi:hypothetical protein
VTVLAAGLLVLVGLGLASPQARGEQGRDATRVEELAERLLTRPPFLPTPRTEPLQVPATRLLPGEIPPNLPVRVPLPPGAQVVGSAVNTMNGQPRSFNIVVDVPETGPAAFSLYEQALLGQGWQATGCNPPLEVGFVPEYGLRGGSFKDAAAHCLTVIVIPRDAQPTDVRLTLELPWQPPVPTSTTLLRPPTMDPLPALYSTAGASLQDATLSVASDGRVKTAMATVETERSPAEIAAVFVQQLQQAGWVSETSGGDGDVKWSRWRLRAEDDWRAVFSVLPTVLERQYMLYLRAVWIGAGEPPMSGGVSPLPAPPVAPTTPAMPASVPGYPGPTRSPTASGRDGTTCYAVMLFPVGPAGPSPVETARVLAQQHGLSMSSPVSIPQLGLIASSATIPSDRLETLRTDPRVQNITEPGNLFSFGLPPCPPQDGGS